MNANATAGTVSHRGPGNMKTTKRGGKRAGAGRTSQLGPTVRRDLRVPEHIERAAITVGAGAFSDGMRYMVEQYLRTAPRSVAAEPPPQGEPVLIWLAEQERWAIVEAASTDDGIVFRETCSPDKEHASDTWRHLPNTADPTL